MSTTYNGLPANVSPPAAVNIASSTNANPIVITTSTNHGLLTGDVVSVAGHQTNTNANGTNQSVTVLSATTFSVAKVGNGVGGATGTVQLISRPAAGILYTDGDAFNAALLNTAVTPPLDRSAFLFQQLGFAKLAGRLVLLQQSFATIWASYSATLAAATLTQFGTMGTLTVQGMESGSLTLNSSTGPYSILGVTSNDIIHVTLKTQFGQSTTTNPFVALMWAITAPGAAAPSAGAFAQVPACSVNVGNPASSSILVSISLEGYIPHPGNGTLYLAPALYSAAGGATTANLLNDTVLTVEAWRPTAWPQ